MSRRPAAATPQPVKVEVEIFQQPVVGLRNPPCCGRPCAPKLIRTRRVGANRIADARCPLCGHLLRITYALEDGTWRPTTAADLNSSV